MTGADTRRERPRFRLLTAPLDGGRIGKPDFFFGRVFLPGRLESVSHEIRRRLATRKGSRQVFFSGNRRFLRSLKRVLGEDGLFEMLSDDVGARVASDVNVAAVDLGAEVVAGNDQLALDEPDGNVFRLK